MAELSRHYVGEEGTGVIIDCQEDISGAVNTKFYIQKPNGDLAEWTAVVYNSNYLKYLTVADSFSESGPYKGQPYMERLGWKGKGRTFSFHIYDDFE